MIAAGGWRPARLPYAREGSMATATKAFNAATRRIAARAGHEAAERLAVVRDELLIEAGRAAEQRQHHRAVQQRVRRTGKRVAAIAAGAAATVVAAIALRRRSRSERRAAQSSGPS